MDNRKKTWIMVISIIISLAGIVGLYYVNQHYAVQINTEQMPVAKRYIPAYTIITEEMIEYKITPKLAISDEAVLLDKDIVGKMTAIPIGQSEQFLYWKLDERGLFPKGDEEIFAIPMDYIISYPDTLKRGDTITIHVSGKPVPLLEDIRIAYARQSSNKEVVIQKAEGTLAVAPSNQESIHNERLFLTGPIDNLEVYLTPSQWWVLDNELQSEEKKLVISYVTKYKEVK